MNNENMHGQCNDKIDEISTGVKKTFPQLRSQALSISNPIYSGRLSVYQTRER